MTSDLSLGKALTQKLGVQSAGLAYMVATLGVEIAQVFEHAQGGIETRQQGACLRTREVDLDESRQSIAHHRIDQFLNLSCIHLL